MGFNVLLRSNNSYRLMSALGHSRPAPTSIKFGHVRYAPKATDIRFIATCR
jgi:hypothetical protein